MTDPEIIDQLRSFYRMKGWPVLREAADRIELLEDALKALKSTRDSIQAMADEGIIAESSWPTIDAIIDKAEQSA